MSSFHVNDNLHHLQAQQEPTTANHGDDDHDVSLIPRSRDEYGFRKSGILTPSSNLNYRMMDYVVPDPNGLGWPGKSAF